ncbi:MAG: type I-E CRISPR-associated protein Cas7/Cse4/CasC [Caldilineaceae bacterium]
MFLELHMIQNFVPSNLNRDDTGSPKDCEFGGHRRARISSQCLKRSIRTNEVFAETTKVPTSKRTHYLANELTDRLVKRHQKSSEQASEIAVSLVGEYAKQMDKKNPEQSAVLIFISDDEMNMLADKLVDCWDDVTGDDKARKAALGEIVKEAVRLYKDHVAAPDIALFGRMLASEPKLNLEAACQVAHAISTHRVSMEMDYFTAVDDVREENEEAGAGHINTMGFNSSCFYRYARIDWRQLLKNLNHDQTLAQNTVDGFLRSSLTAIPSGKKNATGPFNPPSFVLAVVRTDGMGWNLANAFEKPIFAKRDSSLVGESIAALDAYWGKLEAIYGGDTLVCVAAINQDGPELNHLRGERTVSGRDAWIAAVLSALASKTEENGA